LSAHVTTRLAAVWQSPRNRSLALALLVAFGLRLAWALWATHTPVNPLSDTSQYLSYARSFAAGETPSLYGQPTAYFPPGWPMLLSPVSFVSGHTGWYSLEFGAALLNVVLGTATVAFTALLAKEWLGAGARNPAAWIMAVGAGQIYFTSTAYSETMFATCTMAALLATTVVLRPDAAPRARTMVLVGVLIGLTMLVRSPGAILLLAPALTIRATRGSWKGAARLSGLTLLGALVLLVPWTIRNVVEVGVLTPMSTNSAAAMCTGHHEGATGGFDPGPGAIQCFTRSPYDQGNADEGDWYQDTTSRAVKWAVTHPVEEVKLTLWKTYDTMADDREALLLAEDYSQQPLASLRFQEVLRHLADGWHWAVLALSAAGLLWLPACRRALPLWVTAVGYLVAVWAGLALSRYHHGIMPILVVFAAGAISALRSAREPSPEVAAP
jgi:4-amino-4-deoxy-L-arabinose transferase-like glycosyltransferase